MQIAQNPNLSRAMLNRGFIIFRVVNFMTKQDRKGALLMKKMHKKPVTEGVVNEKI